MTIQDYKECPLQSDLDLKRRFHLFTSTLGLLHNPEFEQPIVIRISKALWKKKEFLSPAFYHFSTMLSIRFKTNLPSSTKFEHFQFRNKRLRQK